MTIEEEGFPHLTPVVVSDILSATVTWLGEFDPTEADASLACDIRDYANAHGVSLPEAALALDVEIGARVLATWLLMSLDNWHAGVRAKIPVLLEYMKSGVLDLDSEEPTDQVMICLLRFLSRLADAEVSEARNVDDLRALLAEIEALGDAFEAVGKFECAARCFDIGMNLVGLARAPEFRRCAGRARTHVRRLGDSYLAASILMKNAMSYVALAETDESLALQAFDAVYDAVLALDGQELLRAQSRAFFAGCLQQARYSGLTPLYILGDSSLDRTQLPAQLAAMKLVPPISDTPVTDWLEALSSIQSLFGETENGRLRLEPKPADTTVSETDWTSWEVAHPAYYRAIPHGESFLRETDANLMLVLSHELTHVMSMNGDIGLAILALRSAAFGLLLELYQKKEVGAGGFDYLRALPEIGAPTLRNVGSIERSLHVFRKLQILKAIWSPWFEGLAVYTELADPVEDPEGTGPAMSMLHELVDRKPSDFGTTREEVEASVLRIVAEMEKRYSDVLSRQAAYRLTQYLVARHDGYLAGYLAVRAIVSSWRQTLGAPLSAPIAARVLLHLTRSSTHSAIPDLSLPVQKFEEAARVQHMLWLKGLIRLSDLTLRRAQIPYNSDLPFCAMRWTRGELEFLDEKEALEEAQRVTERVLANAVDAWKTPCSEPPDSARSSTTDDSAVTLAWYSEDLAGRSPHPELLPTLVDRMVAPLSVLPFADVEARFWMNRLDKIVFVVLRTTEKDGSGSASYDRMVIGPGDTAFDALLREVEARGDFRMRVTRVIDTISPGAVADRSSGRHALIMQYGSWLHIQMRGMATGVREIVPSLQHDIRSRMEPDPLDRFNREIITDGRPFAHAILTWLETHRPLGITVNETTLNIPSWANTIEAAAKDVISAGDADLRARVRLELLMRVVGLPEERAEKMLAGGLRSLSPLGCAHPVGELVDLLVRSAQSPVPNAELWPEAEELFVESALGIDLRPALSLRSTACKSRS